MPFNNQATEETVSGCVQHAITAQGLSVSEAARRWGVHRNFLIDLLSGKVPRTRSLGRYASSDPRYTKLANGMEIDPKKFCDLADQQQGRSIRREAGLVEANSRGIVIRLSRDTIAIAPTTMTIEFGGVEVTIAIKRKQS